MSAPRYLEAEFNDRKYRIPEMWLVGFMQSNPGITIPQVLAWWDQQERWTDQYEQESVNAR